MAEHTFPVQWAGRQAAGRTAQPEGARKEQRMAGEPDGAARSALGDSPVGAQGRQAARRRLQAGGNRLGQPGLQALCLLQSRQASPARIARGRTVARRWER